MKWRYSLRWKRPAPCPDEPELASEVVEAGQPVPESVMSLWVAGAGYAVCVDFLYDRPVNSRRSDVTKPESMHFSLICIDVKLSLCVSSGDFMIFAGSYW